jgi:hypothetical protein
MANRDVILTTLHGVRFEYAVSFFTSLRRTGYGGEVVVFTNGLEDEDIFRLRRNGATIVPFRFSRIFVRRRLAWLWITWRWFFQSGAPQHAREWLAHAVFPLYYRRHLLYMQFLREHRQNYDRVFLTDCRDVYFQADPFSWNLPRGLHLFLEDASNKIGRSIHNENWLKTQFNQTVFDELKGETISCAGTVMGDTASVLEYLSKMVLQTMEARSLRETTGDQGIHNYLLYKKFLHDVTIHNNWEGPVMTLGAMHPEDVRVNAQGFVVNNTGKVVPVLHQYDRIPQVEKILRDRLC